MSDSIDDIMHRAEMSTQWANDGPILFEALKDAAAANTKPEDMLKFLKFHIGRGIKGFDAKRALQENQHD